MIIQMYNRKRKKYPDDNTYSFNNIGKRCKYLSQDSTNKSECILATQGNHRDYMEDNRSIYHNGDISIYAMYDGHGGHKTSIRAASELSQILYNNLKDIIHSGDEKLIHSKIKNSFLEFDDKLYNKGSKTFLKDGSTATLVIYVKDNDDNPEDDRMYFVNLGDSRTLLIQITDMVDIIYSTEDHKPTSHAEIIRIHKVGGYSEYGRVNGGVAVSRCLGDIDYKMKRGVYEPVHSPVSTVPEIFCVSATPGLLVLATDGLWDVLTNYDVADIVYNHADLDDETIELPDICRDLIDKAIKRGSQDNISVMLISI